MHPSGTNRVRSKAARTVRAAVSRIFQRWDRPIADVDRHLAQIDPQVQRVVSPEAEMVQNAVEPVKNADRQVASAAYSEVRRASISLGLVLG